jgi:hypothetical protein
VQQHRGLAAALVTLGFAVLGGVAVTAQLTPGKRQAFVPVAPVSPAGIPHTFYGAAPAADFSADDEETVRVTRLLKQRADSAGGALVTHGLAEFVLLLAPVPPAALAAPAKRIVVSLGPRAPPRALNLKLRRLAWQA